MYRISRLHSLCYTMRF